ncbi:MAG: rhomboid family intramembrane serine protease, partial [Bacteroidales bacterium]|nr:rhomboid family intramembrane serine protease [Bacteroidales bacterium]
AVLGVFIAVAVYAPNQEVSLWLVRSFSFKMKYVAMAFVVIDLLSIPASNAGGHIAHLGGALFGWLYVVAMRANVSNVLKSKPFQRKKSQQSSRGGRPMSDDEYNRRRAADQKRVDAILDKISRSGYDTLSKEEKEFLFKFKA